MAKGEGRAIWDIKDYFKLRQYENDSEDYGGSANIAELLLKKTTVNLIYGQKDFLNYGRKEYLLDTVNMKHRDQTSDMIGAWLIDSTIVQPC